MSEHNNNNNNDDKEDESSMTDTVVVMEKQTKLSKPLFDPLQNQLCRVCDEPAAGFHFGAFTCEGCKSFFGRTCNNQSVIQECKNNYRCVVDKKNRTACKACRLRKCLMVGMSKSGSRYGRRSNWFKIHCLMQQQNQQKRSAGSPTQQRQLPSPPVSLSEVLAVSTSPASTSPRTCSRSRKSSPTPESQPVSGSSPMPVSTAPSVPPLLTGFLLNPFLLHQLWPQPPHPFFSVSNGVIGRSAEHFFNGGSSDPNESNNNHNNAHHQPIDLTMRPDNKLEEEDEKIKMMDSLPGVTAQQISAHIQKSGPGHRIGHA